MTEQQEQHEMGAPRSSRILGRWISWGLFSSLTAMGLAVVVWGNLLLPPRAEIRPTLKKEAQKGQDIFRLSGIWAYDHPYAKEQRWGSLLREPVSREWLILYLLSPRKLAENKSAVAHPDLLMRDQKGQWTLRPEGEQLLAYLNRQAKMEHRGGQSELERTQAESIRIRLGEGRRLYRRMCASCHGSTGRGDGVLAAKMEMDLPDLTNHKNILCRSSRLPSTEDIVRTLKRGIPETGMLPVGRSLREWQIASLAEYFRRLIYLNKEGEPSDYLKHMKPYPPTYRQLKRRDFVAWFDRWWRDQHKTWLAKQPKDSALRRYSFPDWKDWKEWQQFGQWLRSDPRRVRTSRADWAAEHMRKFPQVLAGWRKDGGRSSFMRFFMRAMRKRFREVKLKPKKAFNVFGWVGVHARRSWNRVANLVRTKPVTIEADPYYGGKFMLHEFNHWLQRQGYRDYAGWREEVERKAQRKWLEDQKHMMFRAWQGKNVYRTRGCTKCHGNEGEGRTIQVPALSSSKGAKSRSYQVKDFRRGFFRCGSGERDLTFSIIAGPHMALLNHHEQSLHMRRVPIPIAQPQNRTKDARLWTLIAYLRLLAKDLPLNRPVTHP
ncbi:MAG: c-type cytochrome [Myxococcales bacterium]|nr:c-type cytochrome [Myxococcales bacterium]